MATVVYPYDDTGHAATNLVKDEIQTLTVLNRDPYRYFIPNFAPFYQPNFKLEGKNPLGVWYELTEALDYNFNLAYEGCTRANGASTWGGVTIINKELQGPVRVTYQCVGGRYSADRDYVIQTIAEQNYNPRRTLWDQVTSIMEVFPPSNHPQDLDTFTGYRDMIDAVLSLKGVTDTQEIKNLITRHILDHDDPHKTKLQLTEFAKISYVDHQDGILTARINKNVSDIHANTQDIAALKNGIIDDGSNFQQQIDENKAAIALNTEAVANMQIAVAQNVATVNQVQTNMNTLSATTNLKLNDFEMRVSAVETAIGTSLSVPDEYKAEMYLVMAPHMRFMVWDEVSEVYVRAPWHLPGMVQYSYTNPSNGMSGYLLIEPTTAHDQEAYPDLAKLLGLSGVGTFNLVELRGEFIRVLDNGRGLDVNRALLSSQPFSMSSHSHDGSSLTISGNAKMSVLSTGADDGNVKFLTTTTGTSEIVDQPILATSSGQTGSVGGTEVRPVNVALPAWISI